MKVTLTRDLPPHKKGAIREVTPAVARRLIAKGAAKKAETKPKDSTGDGKVKGSAGGGDGEKA